MIAIFLSIILLSLGTANADVEDVESSDEDIEIVMHHLVIIPQEGMLDITEYLIYQNTGDKVFSDSMLNISLPKERKLTTSSIMECCFVQYENSAMVDPMRPIKPGEQFQIWINYKIGINLPEYTFSRSINHKSNMLTLSVQKDRNIDAEALMGLGSKEVIEFDNKNYYSFSAYNLDSYSSFAVKLSGLQPLDIKRKPALTRTQMTGVILIMLIVILIAYSFIRKR